MHSSCTHCRDEYFENKACSHFLRASKCFCNDFKHIMQCCHDDTNAFGKQCLAPHKCRAVIHERVHLALDDANAYEQYLIQRQCFFKRLDVWAVRRLFV